MNLVTDRTESDVLQKNKKGTYGYTDLNRVEQAVSQIAEIAPQLGISLNLVGIKTDWGVPGVFPVNFPTESEMNRFIRNVQTIRRGFGITTPVPDTMRRLTFTGANNIEKVLESAFRIADQTVPNFIFCGEVFAGEE